MYLYYVYLKKKKTVFHIQIIYVYHDEARMDQMENSRRYKYHISSVTRYFITDCRDPSQCKYDDSVVFLFAEIIQVAIHYHLIVSHNRTFKLLRKCLLINSLLRIVFGSIKIIYINKENGNLDILS